MLRHAQLKQQLCDQQAFFHRFLDEIVRTSANQRRLIHGILIARHHQHRQLAFAVAEIDTDEFEQIAAGKFAFEAHVGEHHIGTDRAFDYFKVPRRMRSGVQSPLF